MAKSYNSDNIVQPVIKCAGGNDFSLLTHTDESGVAYRYLGDNSYEVWMEHDDAPYWRKMPDHNIEQASSLRAVADINRIEELELKISALSE